MLRSSGSAVERSGAAHGLSEVLMAKGADRIEMLLPDILTNAGNQDLKDPESVQVLLLECCSMADWY